MKEAAIKRLRNELEALDGKNKHVSAVAEEVAAALIKFCEQNEEFAEAVVKDSRSLGECLTAVVKGVGGYLSDREAYERAADFYFAGAEVVMEPKIRLKGDAPEEDVFVSLEAFL